MDTAPSRFWCKLLPFCSSGTCVHVFGVSDFSVLFACARKHVLYCRKERSVKSIVHLSRQRQLLLCDVLNVEALAPFDKKNTDLHSRPMETS